MNNSWRTDRPTEPGEYLVTLSHTDDFDDFSTKIVKDVCIRQFAEYKKEEELWIMDGQSENDKYVWYIDCSSWHDEKVIAWMPLPTAYTTAQ